MRPESFEKILRFAHRHKVSDIHFQVDTPPKVRQNGELFALKHPPLTEDDLEEIGVFLARVKDREELRATVRDFDSVYAVSGVARFRVNVFRQRGRYAAVLRVIPFDVLDFESLRLPSVLERIANLRRGLVLVTGATGNGKSTALASMIQYINDHRRAHIVTIEDPIEFVFENNQSIVSQREVHSDTESFGLALRAALRQDPDVIMVAELRDFETIDICLKAAETGHMVMAAIHTPDVAKTIGRLLSYFPRDDQATVRQRLAENLIAIVSLRLVPVGDGESRVPACEIMLTNRTVAECIVNPEKTVEIEAHMARNRELGMQTFNQHLIDLVKSGTVGIEQAKLASSHPEELTRGLIVE